MAKLGRVKGIDWGCRDQSRLKWLPTFPYCALEMARTRPDLIKELSPAHGRFVLRILGAMAQYAKETGADPNVSVHELMLQNRKRLARKAHNGK